MTDFEALHAAFRASPANRHLGSQLVAATAGQARVTLPLRPELVQENGVVHGGFLSMLADTAAVYAVVADLPAGHRPIGVEFKISFLEPARADGAEVVADARQLKRGRTLAVVEVALGQGGVPVAHGLFTYLIAAPRPASSPDRR